MSKITIAWMIAVVVVNFGVSVAIGMAWGKEAQWLYLPVAIVTGLIVGAWRGSID